MLPTLTLYDSLSKKIVTLDPGKTGKLSLYVCGATVYDHCHIGHGRIKVVFDAWVRVARSLGYKVNYVMNITDVDDKIITKAQKLGKSSKEVSQYYTDQMQEVDTALGLLEPDSQPRATEYIDEMIAMIQALIDKGHAYVTADKDVYFSVQSYPDYGALSKQDVQQLQSLSRELVDTAKSHSADFVLWKASKPGEPSWPSPWGLGRPGWHIECSAMSTKLLGQNFDLHGGGMDLKFPHHENEIAQSCCAHGGEYARCWMHVGLVMMGQDKMSKSLGNTLILKDLLDKVPAEALRFMYLQTHYSKPLPFTQQQMAQAEQAWRRLDRLVADIAVKDIDIDGALEALQDDFNTPKAIAQMFEWRRMFEKEQDPDEKTLYLEKIKRTGAILGLFQSKAAVDKVMVEDLIAQRQLAKERGDYKAADRIRDQLLQSGIHLKDTPNGVTWYQD